jgi:Leucine-rich repeat (LRR) protein
MQSRFSIPLLLLFLLSAFSLHSQNTTAENEIYRTFGGASLSKALKHPLTAKFVVVDNYQDSIFPNEEILRLKNVEHLRISARNCRLHKTDSLLSPLKIKIDTNKLRELTSLKYLELSSFDFSNFPVEICAMTNLEGLALSLGFIDSIPKEIARMKNLEVLELRLNNISFLPDEITRMENLTVLDLSNNLFRTLPPQLLHISKLKTLNLANFESERAFEVGWMWPYTISINQVECKPQAELLRSLAKLGSLKTADIALPSHMYFQELVTQLGGYEGESKIHFHYPKDSN